MCAWVDRQCMYQCLHHKNRLCNSPPTGPANCLSVQPQLGVYLYLCVDLCLYLSLKTITRYTSPISGPAYCLLWPLSASQSNLCPEREPESNLCPMQLVEVEATARPLRLNNHHHNQKVQTITTKNQTKLKVTKFIKVEWCLMMTSLSQGKN